MIDTTTSKSSHPLAAYIERLKTGEALLKDSKENVLDVVGILKSYGIVLEAYYKNLLYISEHQFLVIFPFFKYFNGDISFKKLLKHWWGDRINYEYAEYCMKGMLWHGGGGLDEYLDSPEFMANSQAAIKARFKRNPLMLGLHQLFPDYLPEQVRQQVYYSALGQFWRVMSKMFLDLSDFFDKGEIQSIPQVVEHIKAGLVAAASLPITYAVKLDGCSYDIIPESAGITFLADTAVPYVEAMFG